MLRPGKITQTSLRPIAALILGIIPGLLSIWGIGHIFAGNSGKGIALLVLGLLMAFVGPLILLLLAPNLGDLAILAIIGIIAWIILWLYQSIDAYWEAGGV
jgi:hypothetical protein